MMHPDCAYLARTIPSLVSDKHKPEDVDSDGEDHSADALRYFAMSRPAPGSLGSKPPAKEWTLAWLKAQGAKTGGILSSRGVKVA
jgi:hypothetical protein